MNLSETLRKIDLFISTLTLFFLVSLVVAQIVARSVFSLPLAGSEELSRYLLLWVVFVPLALVARSGEQIRMMEIRNMLPPIVVKILGLLSVLLGVTSYGVVAFSAALAAVSNIGRVTPSLEMPFLLFYLPTVLGFVLFTLEYILVLLRVLIFRDLSLLNEKKTSTFN